MGYWILYSIIDIIVLDNMRYTLSYDRVYDNKMGNNGR